MIKTDFYVRKSTFTTEWVVAIGGGPSVLGSPKERLE